MNIKNLTIHQLRLNGFKVRVNHFRFVQPTKGLPYLRPIKNIRDDKLQNSILPKGGQTTVELTTKEGKDYSETINCYFTESFNRKRAILICLGRIAKQIEKYNIAVEANLD